MAPRGLEPLFGPRVPVDTVAPLPVIQRVKDPAAPAAPVAAPRAYVAGVVTERGTQTPVAGAVLRYDGRSLTGMVASEDGTFRSTDLESGTYTLNVTAPGYRDGQCVRRFRLPELRERPAPAAPAPAPAALPPSRRPAEWLAQHRRWPHHRQRDLRARSAAQGGHRGRRNQRRRDGSNGHQRSHHLTDPLIARFDLAADSSGGFSVGNVKPGNRKLSVEAAGYFTSAIEVQVESRKEVQGASCEQAPAVLTWWSPVAR